MRPASAGRSLAHGVTYTGVMIRWLLVTFLALMLIGWLSPLLRRLGFGRLPGDLRFRWLGRGGQIPLSSPLLLGFLGGGGVADSACIYVAAEFAGRRVGEMALSLMPGWAVGAIGIRSRWRRPALGAGIVRRRQC